MLSILLLALTAHAADGPPLNGLAIRDVTRALPACSAHPPDKATLDLASGCVAGACTGMTREELDEALGQPSTCKTSHATKDTTICEWLDGAIKAHFHEDRGPEAGVLFVSSTDWRDSDGLGVGAELSCFLDRHGQSAVGMRVDVEEGWLLIHSVHLRSPAIIVTTGSDGKVDKVQLNAH